MSRQFFMQHHRRMIPTLDIVDWRVGALGDCGLDDLVGCEDPPPRTRQVVNETGNPNEE